MNQPSFYAWFRVRRRQALLFAPVLLALTMLALLGLNHSLAAPAADCSNGNVSTLYQDQDVTLSGDLYVTNNVTVRNAVTVTLAAGSNVTMCGAYQISINNGGNLRALGEEAQPITFAAADPAVKWDRIIFSSEANHSLLRHVVLNDGGGNDPTASAGAIEFGSTLAANPLPSPTLDHVTVNDSGAYGLYLQVSADDTTPPSITHVTINNSARAAVLANAQALGGLGNGNVYTNNNPDSIQVISGGASRLYHSQIWQRQSVPYELLGTAMVAAPDAGAPYPTLTIEPGTTLLMHPDARLDIGTSLGRGASLVAQGTAGAPITFSRVNNSSAPWDKLRLSLYPGTEATLEHVDFSYGGSNGPATIEQLGAGALSLDHVSVRNSLAAGVHAQGGVNVVASTFEFNQVGLEFQFASQAIIRNSTIRNNLTAGLLSLDTGSDFTRNCIDAIGNFWGSADGPADSYDQDDACGQANSNGGGDSVSGGVLYSPWLPGDGPLLDRGTIQPDSFYVVADGVDSTAVTITLRDAAGNPLAGKEVQLKTSAGTVRQPSQPTDASGATTAVISATVPGFAYLSAYNQTDDAPVAGLGGVTFWQGAGDGGGLIDPGGTPYAAPQLLLSGAPFQSGFPVGMRLPMQNSNSTPVDVQVVYGVSGLGLGTRFTPVYTATNTLQPGESWDAQGAWLPTSSGHRCIQATIVSSEAPATSIRALLEETTTRQKNTDQDPCNPETLDPGNIFPKKYGGGLLTIANYAYRLYTISKRSNECLSSYWGTDQGPFGPLAPGDLRDYQQVVTPLAFNPPEITAGGDVTPEQAAVLNAMAQTTADLLSLNLALGATAQRMNWAAQAVGGVGSAHPLRPQADSDLYYLDLQYEAYRNFANQYADKLDLFADQIEQLLAVMDSSDNVTFLAEDFQKTRDRLASNGFDAEDVSFYQQTGLDAQLITQLAEDVVADFDNQPSASLSFFDALTDIQASSRALATRLRDQYPAPANNPSLLAPPASAPPSALFVPPQVFDLTVGHPFPTEETVELVVRPVNLPLGWTYELSRHSATLAPGETVDVALTLHPGNDLLEGDLVQVVVEGSVNGELVGGVQLEYLAPSLTPRFPTLQLPLIRR